MQSCLYRPMIRPLVDGGHRVLVRDQAGFGRSDKPTASFVAISCRCLEMVWSAFDGETTDYACTVAECARVSLRRLRPREPALLPLFRGCGYRGPRFPRWRHLGF